MKLLASALLLFPLLSLAAKSKDTTTQSVFEKYHAKALSASPITLKEESYWELVASPRNHSLALCLTAMGPKLGCQMCHAFQPEWDMLGKSWTAGDKKGASRLIFATIDFADGKSAFQALQLETAPVVIYFPPTAGPNAVDSPDPKRFDFSTGPPTAEVLHAWIARHLPASAPKPPVRRPFNWLRIIGITTFGLGALTAVTVAWPHVQIVVQNRNLWAAGCLIAILLFTSGHMYNHIRGVPYVGHAQGGKQSYFASGFSNQYGLESQIVAGMYAVLAFGTLALALKVPRIQNPKTQQASVFIWGGVVYLVYSFLFSVFRVKNSGYPYGLPPF